MSKYHSKKVVLDGITFDSRKESERYAFLKEQEKCGIIADLQLQVPFVLIPKQYSKELTNKNGKPKVAERPCTYLADFVYKIDGKTIVEDTKGFKTPEYVIKRKLMLYIHGIEIHEI